MWRSWQIESRARSSPDVDGVEDSADFMSFFQTLYVNTEDFSLDLKADGEAITADEVPGEFTQA